MMGHKKVMELLAAAACLLVAAAIFAFAIQEALHDDSLFAIPYAVITAVCTVLALLCVDMSRYRPADSLPIGAMFVQYIRYVFITYIGWFYNRSVKRKLQDCRTAQEGTLNWIISLNSDTVYGREHQLACIKSRDDLVLKHPLTTYSHYEAYTERVRRGEPGVMSRHKPAIVAASSGTTGKNKYYPFSLVFIPRVMPPFFAFLYMHAKFHHSIGLKRVFQFRLFHPAEVNEHGVEEGGVGNIIMKPHTYNITPKCFLKAQLEPANFFIQAVFALKEHEIGSLEGYSSDLWYCFFKFISEHHEQICDVIESGVFSSFPGLPEELRWELNKTLRSAPERAAFLRPILSSEDVKGLARLVWPGLECIMSAKAGGFSHSAQLLQASYTHGVLMFTTGHMATEAFIGMTYDDPIEDDVYVFATTCTFFEFIPVECSEDKNPTTLFIDQLEVGKCYEVVVTNSDGLYRNRFGDVVKIVGSIGDTPKYKFMYRTGQILNIAFDRTPESIFYNALEETRQSWDNVEIVNYTATESMHLDGIAVDLPSPAHYVTFMEAVQHDQDATITDEHAAQLDDSLCLHHQTYKEFRDVKSVGPIRIIQVKSGTFNQLRDLLTGGKLKQQYKSPRVMRKPAALKLLWDNRLN